MSRKVIRRVVHAELRQFPEIIQVGGDSIFKRLYRWLGLNTKPRGVYVELGEGELALSITLVVEYGVNLPELCKRVRRRITQVLTRMTGLKIRTIHIHVPSMKAARGGVDLELQELPPRLLTDTEDEGPGHRSEGRFRF